ncbi:hypothetical protein A2U01_0017300, partial [Trifolium medium]|nr:hypothetical protein [Trifolium medium]
MDDFPDADPPLNPPSTPVSDEVWMVPEIHEARSIYISIGIDKSFRVVGNPDEWEAVLPGADYAVSDKPLTCVVPMHEVVI